MTVELRSLRVVPEFDASKYTAGAQQKVAADKAMTASSQAVGAAAVQTDAKISQAGDVLARLSRQYVDGYANAQKMQSAVNSLSRGIETGRITMAQAQPILDGIFRKYGQLGDGAQFAAKGQLEFAAAITSTTARLGAQVAAANAAATATGRVNVAANQNGFRGAQNFSAANVAAQFQDIGVTAAMGMSPLQIALQQGTQLSAVLGTQGAAGAARTLGMALMSVVSPVSLITIGIVGLSAAAIQYFGRLISDSEDSEQALKAQAELINSVAREWGDALPSLKNYNDELARQKSLSDALEASRVLGNREFDPFRSGGGVFAFSESQIGGMRADLADLIDKLQGAGAEASGISALQAAFDTLAAKIANSSATGDDALRVQTEINELARATGIPTIADYGTQFGTLAEQIQKASERQAKFIEDAAQLQLLQGLNPLNPLDGFNRTPFQTSEDIMFERSRRERERQEQLIAGREIDGFVPTPRPNDIERLGEGPSGADYIRSQQERIELLKTELGLVGETAEVRQRAVASLQVEQEIRRRGLDLHGAEAEAMRRNAAEEIDLIEQVSARRKREAEERRREISEMDEVRSTFRGFLSDMKNGLQQGQTFWEAFGNAALRVLDRIMDRWLDLLTEILLGQSGTNQTGMLGGLFKSMLGGGGQGSGLGLNFFPAAPASNVTKLLSPANSNNPALGNVGSTIDFRRAGSAASGSIADYIRQAAAARGIDPEIALRVARSEGGLKDPFRQGESMLSYGREESYGPFQLHMRNGGVGARALAAGVDPRTNWRGGVDYGLDEAARKGWGQWFGAAKAGIGNREGLEGARPLGVYNSGAEALTKMAESAENAAKSLHGFDTSLVDMAGKLTSKDGPLGGLFNTGLDNFGNFMDGRNGGLGALLGYGGGGSGGGGGGGLLGMLFSFLPKLFGFADGTDSAPPGYAWVGERGPEIVRFRGGEQVVPNHKLGGGNSQPAQPSNIIIQLQGANGDAHVRALVSQGVQAGLAGYHANQTRGGVNEVQQRFAANKG